MKKLIVLSLLVLLSSCYNKDIKVKEIKDGLFIDKKGSFLLMTVDNSIPNKPKDKFILKVYINGEEPSIQLKKTIDTATFQKINNNHFLDKNHIYYLNKTLDGGSLSTLNKKDSIKFMSSWKIQR